MKETLVFFLVALCCFGLFCPAVHIFSKYIRIKYLLVACSFIYSFALLFARFKSNMTKPDSSFVPVALLDLLPNLNTRTIDGNPETASSTDSVVFFFIFQPIFRLPSNSLNFHNLKCLFFRHVTSFTILFCFIYCFLCIREANEMH